MHKIQVSEIGKCQMLVAFNALLARQSLSRIGNAGRVGEKMFYSDVFPKFLPKFRILFVDGVFKREFVSLCQLQYGNSRELFGH